MTMVDQQIRALSPDQAIDAELTRIIQIAENVDTYRHETLRVYAYKLLRETFPERINRERWRELSGREADGSLVREDGYTWADDRRLLREHGRASCCQDCDRERADAIRRQPPAPPPEEEEVCDHGAESGEWLVRCCWCNGARDCDHDDRSCPDCNQCEADHECQECGDDSACDHRYRCTDCREDIA